MFYFGLFFVFGVGATIGTVIALAKAKQSWWKALIPLPIGTFIYLILLTDAMSAPYTLTGPDELPILAVLIGLVTVATLYAMARKARKTKITKE